MDFTSMFIGSGMTAILMYGKPTAFIRKGLCLVGLEGLTKCALCMGFWVGVVMTLAYTPDIMSLPWLEIPFMFPFGIASFSYLMDALIGALLTYSHPKEMANSQKEEIDE